MKIKKLNMRCGSCAVTEFCGEPWCYAVCKDSRFADVDDGKYAKIAYNFDKKSLKKYGLKYELIPPCKKCKKNRKNGGFYSDYCEAPYNGKDENCRYYEEAKDNICYAVADYVFAVLEPRRPGWCPKGERYD